MINHKTPVWCKISIIIATFFPKSKLHKTEYNSARDTALTLIGRQHDSEATAEGSMTVNLKYSRFLLQYQF